MHVDEFGRIRPIVDGQRQRVARVDRLDLGVVADQENLRARIRGEGGNPVQRHALAAFGGAVIGLFDQLATPL